MQGTFKVLEPTVDATEWLLNPAIISYPHAGKQYVGLGNLYSAPQGAFFDTQVSAPTDGWTYSFAQVVDADFTVIIAHGPGGIQPGNIPNTSGLDRSFPYPGAGPRDYIKLEASDSPAETLFPGEYMCRVFVATTWLMAGPLDDNGNPINRGTWVPLQSITWAFVSFGCFGLRNRRHRLSLDSHGRTGSRLALTRTRRILYWARAVSTTNTCFSNTAVFPQWTKILR